MNAGHRGSRRPAVITSGLAMAAAVAITPHASAAVIAPHNEQVALVNETNAQPLDETKSHTSGTGQVASYDGSSIVFSSDAALVPEDTNGVEDVYLRTDGFTILVSQHGETVGNDASFEPTISDNGRWVAFTTWATNLTDHKDKNGPALDVLVRDLHSEDLQLVSQTTAGFQRDADSMSPVISGDGRSVSFQTFGSFGPDDDDRKEDVYVRQLRAGKTVQASLSPRTNRDIPGPMLNGDISDDGSKVVFGYNDNLWVRNVKSGKTTRFWHEGKGAPCSFNGGTAGRPVISGNGRYVAFSSCATQLPGDNEFGGIYRIDLKTSRLVTVVAGSDGNSYLPSLSRSGRFVGFGSEASDLVKGDVEGQHDAFVADLAKGTITRASQDAEGVGGNSWSAENHAAISGDGHTLVYASYADNLVEGDLSDYEEVFAWHD